MPLRAPNFVVIVVDDLGWTDLGCYGSSFYETPSIDRLADESLTFSSGYAASPVCSPTRVSIQTGKHPARLLTTEWFGGLQPNVVLEGQRNGDLQPHKLLPAAYVDHLPREEQTLAELLRAHDYRTFYAGKWHLGGEGFYPEDQGYQINKGGLDWGWPEGGYFSPYQNPKLANGPEGEHLPHRLASEAIQFLEQLEDDKFFVMLSFYSVHVPLEARPDLLANYEAKAHELGDTTPRFRPEDGVQNRQVQDNSVYATMIEATDQAVGELLAAIDRLGHHDDTVVFLLSDNGGLSTAEGLPTSNLPLRAGKGWLYEGGIRIPWMIRFPGVAAPGSRCDSPVMTTDIYPTVMELVGEKMRSRGVSADLDGVSLLALLAGDKAPEPRTLYWHYPHYSNQGGPPGSALRSGKWKLIECYEEKKVELYDLSTDIGETKNLADACPETAKKLYSMLAEWRKGVAARTPESNPAFPGTENH